MSRKDKRRANAQWFQELLKKAPPALRDQLERPPTTEELVSLHARLSEIPDATVRTVATLRYVEGMPLKTISKRLGLTQNEAMDCLARALAAVRRKIFSAEDGSTHSLN